MRAAIGAAVLGAIVLIAGTEPFLQGLAAVTAGPAAAAVALGAVTTAAAAWRWRVIARRLDLELGRREAVAAYYRSQFLNSVLPGGVLGDVHRAIAHGRTAGGVANASRAVVWERAAGQAVQIALATIAVVAVGMSGYSPAVSTVLLAVTVLCLTLVLAAAVSARARRFLAGELRALRSAFGSPSAAFQVVAASVLVIGGLVATFVVACVAVGVDAPLPRLIALALITVLAGSLPLNIAGWGPREGAAAAAFAAAGLGAATGIAASTAFGVLALIAVAPGAAVLAASALRRHRGARASGQAA